MASLWQRLGSVDTLKACNPDTCGQAKEYKAGSCQPTIEAMMGAAAPTAERPKTPPPLLLPMRTLGLQTREWRMRPPRRRVSRERSASCARIRASPMMIPMTCAFVDKGVPASEIARCSEAGGLAFGPRYGRSDAKRCLHAIQYKLHEGTLLQMYTDPGLWFCEEE